MDACVCCTAKCCSWAAAHVAWLRGGGDADSLDASEALFRVAVTVRGLARCIYCPYLRAHVLTAAACARTQADPHNAAALAAYAIFVHGERENKALASELFEQAAELAPADLDVLASWAYFAMLDDE